jgi:hypothetical protein
MRSFIFLFICIATAASTQSVRAASSDDCVRAFQNACAIANQVLSGSQSLRARINQRRDWSFSSKGGFAKDFEALEAKIKSSSDKTDTEHSCDMYLSSPSPDYKDRAAVQARRIGHEYRNRTITLFNTEFIGAARTIREYSFFEEAKPELLARLDRYIRKTRQTMELKRCAIGGAPGARPAAPVDSASEGSTSARD